jgi:hypothetical protein
MLMIMYVLPRRVQVYCFDKTGTLTTDTLDFLGARQVVPSDSGSPQLGALAHPEEGKQALSRDITRALASCHAVAKFGSTFVGNQVGVALLDYNQCYSKCSFCAGYLFHVYRRAYDLLCSESILLALGFA